MEIAVTALVGCPYFSIKKPFTDSFRYMIEHGERRHREIERDFTSKGLLVEVPLVLEVEGIKIKGKLDALDPENHVIYEVKSKNMSMRGFRQLLLYRDMYAELYGVEPRLALVLYDSNGYQVVTNFLYLPELGSMLREVLKLVKILRKEPEETKVACEDCKYCLLRPLCRPRLRWFNTYVVAAPA